MAASDDFSLLPRPLIGRIWRGRTRAAQADEYLRYNFREGTRKILDKPGCLGVQFFRRLEGGTAEFTTLSYWEDVAAMRAMQGGEGDPMRVAALPRDPEFLLELPESVELVELHANSWTRR
jgi:hypothetical protein